MKRTLQVACWLAVRNLIRRGRVASTVVATVALALLMFLVVLMTGVFFGHQQVEKAKLLQDPLTLCLWLGHPALREHSFDDKRLKDLEQTLADLPGVREWYPCREINVDWFLVGRPEAEESITVRGRTIDPRDPFCQALGVRWAQNSSEVVVSEEFLRRVGHAEGTAPPQELRFRSATGRHRLCKVKGVFRRELPWQHQFVVSEDWYERQFPPQAEVRTSTARTGPMPKDWPSSWEEFPEIVRDMFQSYGFFPPQKALDSNDEPYWVIVTSDGSELALREFRIRLEMICRQMRQTGFSSVDEDRFLDGLAVYGTDSEQPKLSLRPYNLVAVYVKSLSDLKPVKEALEARGFYVRDTAYVIQRLDELAQRMSRLGAVVIGMFLALGGGLFTLLAGVHMMRAEARFQEIGTLKALGMSTPVALAVLTAEAVFLWAAGGALGLGAGALVGKFLLGPMLLGVPEELRHCAFVLPPAQVTALALLTLGTSLIALVGTSWRALKAPPIMTVAT